MHSNFVDLGFVGGDDDLPHLCEHVLIQILKWLPVISLLRFKSVCKSWQALIESSFFIDLHTVTTFNSSSSKQLDTFILHAFEYNKYKKMFMLSFGSGGDQVMSRVDNLGFPPCSKDSKGSHSILMVGSCNGLICIHDSLVGDVFLWNPATRQFRTLPKSITIEEKVDGVGLFIKEFVAFGFDVKTKDYKVVGISCFTPSDSPMGEGCICRVQVYSLSTDSWRLLEGINSWPVIPKNPWFHNQGIYLNGSYFFVGSKCITRWSYRADRSTIPICNNSMMLSFDFTKEIFTIMQFPDHDTRHNLILSYLGDKITVVKSRISYLPKYLPDHNFDGYTNFDVWVLNGHDCGMNKESWTKLHSFRIENKTSFDQPRCILNGKLALITTTHGNQLFTLGLFNLLTKEVEKDFTIGDGVLTKEAEKYIAIGDRVLRADIYKQSLVSIIGEK